MKLKYSNLGKTDIVVSELGFGSLTMGPLQKNMSLEQGAGLLRYALDKGINFIDTAELYEVYPYILEACGANSKVVVSSKSYAYTYEGMRDSVQYALDSLKRSYIDVFSLHEQTSRLTLKGHEEAIRYLQDAKRLGLIRAVGVSTHTVEVVRSAAMRDDIDVIHPIINMQGLGIIDGTVADMLEAIKFAHYMGKGMYAMKILAGGHLSSLPVEAIEWIRSIPEISSSVIGMQNTDEVDINMACFTGDEIPSEQLGRIVRQVRNISVEDCCVGCGRCIAACNFGCIELVDGKANIDRDSCVRCAYCVRACPQFSIKVF